LTPLSSGHPYGAVPRATTGSFRIPFDTTIASDPYGAILFSQDPLFGIDYDSPFPDSISQTPFFLTSSIPTVESIQMIRKSIHRILNKNVRIILNNRFYLSNHRFLIINYGNKTFLLFLSINLLRINMKMMLDHFLESKFILLLS